MPPIQSLVCKELPSTAGNKHLRFANAPPDTRLFFLSSPILSLVTLTNCWVVICSRLVLPQHPSCLSIPTPQPLQTRPCPGFLKLTICAPARLSQGGSLTSSWQPCVVQLTATPQGVRVQGQASVCLHIPRCSCFLGTPHGL